MTEVVHSAAIVRALEADKDLLVCKACGGQYDVESPAQLSPPNVCPLCEDPRQAVPASGQAWTSIGAWLSANEPDRFHALDVDPQDGDERIYRISVTKRAAGIGGQTPIVIVTKSGLVVWDCCATCTPSMFTAVEELAQKYRTNILAVAISHPHFYTTALTWAKALRTKVYVSHADREWWMRREEQSVLDRYLVVYDTPTYTLAPGVTLVRCGGHFDGSAVLLWDRAVAGTGSPNGHVPTTTVCFPSDTFMPAANHRQFAFMWSYPNSLPLPPQPIVDIWRALKPYEFDDVIGSWPGTYVKGDARTKLLASAKLFIKMEGHDPDSFAWDDL